ncbi:MAG: hypothetical protein FJ279_22210 [Planctomycetes bacterium]|nr:hypothetical protein [Planctomycetota bacterium]
MKRARYKTPEQIVTEGFAVLVKGLGSDGALEFLHQYEAGQGDYTKERRQLLRNVTLADLKKRLLRTTRRRG